ncbi:biotin transporter BioY [uncultured Amnibacterium sp.]|uniref:biotin transporter BioY n=1 Tax=uncultured Amnibacterium sp. TaxID=1631851 RepID=UPI0035C990CD
MSSIPLAPVRPVLADRVLPRSLVTDALLVVGGMLLTAALAQVEVPLRPVPVTGQTLAVLLVGAALGPVRGALSMALYVLVGALGAPVFSGFDGGTATILGPTGGYLLGFVLAAAATGLLAQRRWERGLLTGMLAFVGGSGVVFLLGLPWLKASLDLSWGETLASGLYPFVIGGLVKAAIAAGVLRGAWALVDRADARKDR